jgi:hypothetical protein
VRRPGTVSGVSLRLSPGHAALVLLPLLAATAGAEPVPGDRLFRGVEPVHVAGLAAGAAFAPDAGPWCAAVAVLAGSDEPFGAWDLKGPQHTRHGRRLLGAQTLFLGGFLPAAGLGEAGALQVGEATGCWTLIDTDQFRPLPLHILEKGKIRDGADIATGALEVECFEEIVTQAHYTSLRAFQKAARRDLTYAQVFADPAAFRGQPVHIEGLLRMLSREEPPLQCRADGVSNLYEAWILNEGSRELFCFLSTELPPALVPYLGEEGKKKLKQRNVEVSADGYFYKKFRYKAIDSKTNTARDAPAFIGHSLAVRSPAAEGGTEAAVELSNQIIAVFIGIVGFGVVVVVGLTWWFRRSDYRVRGRLLAARHTGFVPPPAGEDVPAAPPAEPPAADPDFGGRMGDFSGPAR